MTVKEAKDKNAHHVENLHGLIIVVIAVEQIQNNFSIPLRSKLH